MAAKRILIVDDEPGYRELYAGALRAASFETLAAASGEEAIALIAGGAAPDMVVSDVRMPGIDGLELIGKARAILPELPFLMITAFPDLRDAVSAMKTGAVDYLEKPIDLDELTTAVSDALGVRPAELGANALPQEALAGVVAESPLMKALLRDAYKVARSDATVLICGESGSGKEVLAKFLHRCGPRAHGPFIALNCAAMPGTLLAGELFGHRKGAFTGAIADRAGLFMEASGGTLFLDEIGDMPLELQPSLLRAIETRRITPLGSAKESVSDVRLIAASNRDLPKLVEEKRFRADLYYRLNVVAFELPPLRERPEDVLPLARLFLARDGRQSRLSPSAAKLAQRYRWPGNVRELANAMERAALLSGSEIILPEHLPAGLRDQSLGNPAQDSRPLGVPLTVQEAEADAIRAALASSNGNRTKAAELLGISRRTLIYKLKRFEELP
jgi:DNA-binding NtrC family response regulator